MALSSLLSLSERFLCFSVSHIHFEYLIPFVRRSSRLVYDKGIIPVPSKSMWVTHRGTRSVCTYLFPSDAAIRFVTSFSTIHPTPNAVSQAHAPASGGHTAVAAARTHSHTPVTLLLRCHASRDPKREATRSCTHCHTRATGATTLSIPDGEDRRVFRGTS